MAAFVGGPPTAAVLTYRWWSPYLPTAADLRALLNDSGPAPVSLVLAGAAVVLAALWLVLAAALLYVTAAEILAVTAGIRLPRPRLPGPLRTLAAGLAGTAAAGVGSNLALAAPPAVITHIDAIPEANPTARLGTARQQPATVAAAPRYRVAEGDWMWHIAGRTLGAADRYLEIADLNPQYADDPDFPDIITPGWTLTLPTEAHDRGSRTHAHGTYLAAIAPPPNMPAPAPRPERPDHADTPWTAPPPAAQDTPEPAQAAPEPDETDLFDLALPVTATLATSGLLAALLLNQLHRQRNRQLQHRRLHHRLTAAPQPQTETTVRAAARPADIERLDHALRALTHLLRDTPTERLPDIIAVWISPDALHLILTTPVGEPPSPFATDPADTRWLLDAEAVLPAVNGDEVALLPTLVTVASHPQGHHLLVDLERVGILAITGDPRQAADMLRYLAAELATSTWSDDTDIIVTGLTPADAEHLTALGGHRLRTVSAAQAHTLAQHRATTASADRLAARISHAHDAQPSPLVILATGPDTATAVGLTENALHDAEAIAAASRADTRFTLQVDADGTVNLDWLNTTGLYATGLPADQLANLARLFRSAQSRQPAASAPVDEPVPPATEEWANGTDAHGHLLPELTVVAPAEEPAGNTPPKPTPTPVPATRRLRVPDSDATLDADLADWHNPATTRLRIAILGPVDVQAAGPPPDERLRFHREIVVYLASRGRHGATGEQLDAALWPETIVSPRSRRVAMSRTRRWLAETPDGQPWLPPNNSIDRTYHLHDGYLLDWHLFRRLRTRAETTGPDGAADLRRALELVRGQPLAGADLTYSTRYRTPYAWLPDSAIQPHHLVSAIVDTVHQYVALCLDAGDLASARRAVDIAWQADRERAEDHPWLDAIRIAYRAGHQVEVRTLLDDLVQARDAEVPEDLTVATYREIITLMPEIVGAG
ncbi:peptidoglycan-binding protein [Catenuloplanes japonicus]|uniref:peptidoglycan-binding protein n=1 Tax=Catenuloplanes japonicus TaxID=33876 RepID=UPI0012F7DAF9|nr:peptidoglycan-binding protein [Catenuloplanes japonicus]